MGANLCGCSNIVNPENEAHMMSKHDLTSFEDKNRDFSNNNTPTMTIQQTIDRSDTTRNNEKVLCSGWSSRSSQKGPLDKLIYTIQANKIVRAYRKYKTRINLLKHKSNKSEYHAHTSWYLNKSNICNFIGERDSDGNKCGFGIQKWKDCSKYIGMFNNNKAKGYGRFYHPDGDRYNGEFNNDRANGYGEYYHENGAVYYGIWIDDAQFDIGYEEWTDSSKYSGCYGNGKKNGIGTYIWQDKTMYQGEWKENAINGYGIYYFFDGRLYIGQWKSNQMHGYGEFTWQEGKKYYGFYQNDKKCGFGIYYWPIGKYYIGMWKDGKQWGLGKYIKGCTIKYGIWKNGTKECWWNEQEFYSKFKSNEKQFAKMFNMELAELKQFMNNEI